MPAPLPPGLASVDRGSVLLTDGGLETTLVFLDGIDLPDFAAFPLLSSEDGKVHLDRYFAPYLDVAERAGVGFVVDTVTWRANPDWGLRLGCDALALAEVNRRAVGYAARLAASRPGLTTVVNGVVGPRGDGYVVGTTMTADEAAGYHALQADAFRAAGAQLMTAVTMTYVEEAIGIVEAARQVDLPVVVSFTVETDGRLPSGQALGDAIEEVDRATDGAAAYFMVNCAHPTHFAAVLETGLERGEAWVERVQAIRANASTMSHAELDAADELDRGDVQGLARHYTELQRTLPHLRVAGGCCGTDHEHIAAIADALTR
jgi:S-methylmethionine-dependent homocysteine/selenocysteine methylase